MVAYSFLQELVPLIQSGQKQQTIRTADGKQHPIPGDLIVLCTHRSRQKIMEAICTDVLPIMIHDGVIIVAGAFLKDEALLDFVKADGFKSVKEFLRFFERHPSPFHGIVIKWRPILEP